VRETLFNWLHGFIKGSRCLDLYAGSGALGFEAASRGAASITMVDVNPLVVDHLRTQANKLGASHVEIVIADARSYLAGSLLPFDIVFIDPPFVKRMVEESCIWLERYNALKPNGRIYIETEAAAGRPQLPEHWQRLRAGQAGQVAYYLVAAQVRSQAKASLAL
jgi:16S rRNA (guanine966-N2)-methyltransferase